MELALSEFGCECEPDRRDLEICLTHPDSAVDSLAWWTARFSSGRSVARQPAMMQAPASMVLQMEMLTTFQKKSSVWVSPSTNRKRIIEQMQPLSVISKGVSDGEGEGTNRAAKHKTKPTENFDLRSMLAFQRIKTGRMINKMSVTVLKPAYEVDVSFSIHFSSYVLRTLLICHEKIQVMRCASAGQLLHSVVVQIRSTSKKDVEERCGGREDADTDGDVNEDEMPTPDDNAREEDAE